jgi:hypothetical protein
MSSPEPTPEPEPYYESWERFNEWDWTDQEPPIYDY